MGYTHYWRFTKNPKDVEDGDKKFAKAVELLKKCLAKVPAEMTVTTYEYDWKTGVSNTITHNIPFRLAGGDGTGEAVLTDNKVCFNGVDGEYDYSHETCYLTLDNQNYEFDFCKTAQKPYDVAVCLTLLCFKKAFGDDFNYSSDGTNKDWGWKLAHEIFDKMS